MQGASHRSLAACAPCRALRCEAGAVSMCEGGWEAALTGVGKVKHRLRCACWGMHAPASMTLPVLGEGGNIHGLATDNFVPHVSTWVQDPDLVAVTVDVFAFSCVRVVQGS
eukprot:scaffold72460_cov18-Tisochrysis_lutea.AAC.1